MTEWFDKTLLIAASGVPANGLKSNDERWEDRHWQGSSSKSNQWQHAMTELRKLYSFEANARCKEIPVRNEGRERGLASARWAPSFR